MNAALRRLGFSTDDATSHGFRASASTLLNESGLWSAYAVERSLAHVHEDKSRRAYARGQYWDERVRMAQWWAEYLGTLRKGATIIQMPRSFYAMAEDGVLPRAFLRVNPDTQVQEVGLLFFGATMLLPAFLLGSFENPLSRAQIEQKFRTYAAGVLPDAAADAVVKAVDRLEDLGSVGKLMALLNGGNARTSSRAIAAAE